MDLISTYVDIWTDVPGLFFTRRTLFPPLDKRNTCDKAKGLLGHFEVEYRGAGRAMPLYSKNSGQDSRQQSQYGLRRGTV